MNPQDMIGRLSGQMSLGRRLANTAALVGGLCAAFIVGLLWATEPGLPARTEVAFGALIVLGLAWTGYGAWALTRRTPLFALDRVIAAWIAVAATGVLAVATFAVAILRDGMPLVLYVIVAALATIAIVNLARARAYRAVLLRRKQELGG
jgi:hypothetical protein